MSVIVNVPDPSLPEIVSLLMISEDPNSASGKYHGVNVNELALILYLETLSILSVLII